MSAGRLGFTLAAAVLAALFVALGLWQSGRAGYKEALLEGHARALAAPPLPLAEAMREGELPRRVEASGRFPAAPVVVLDNQLREGRPGVRIYRVFEPAAGPAALLVDMGWLPWGPRRTLPELDPPPPRAELAGLLTAWPGQGIALGELPPAPAAGEPWLLIRIDREAVQAALAIELFDGVLRLDPSAPFGHRRDAAPLAGMLPPQRHRGYAVQWFGLAAAVLVVYGVLMWKTRRR